MIHVEEHLLNWTWEENLNWDRLNWRRKHRGGNSLNKVIAEAGRPQPQASPLQLALDLGCTTEQCAGDWKGRSSSDNIGGLAHR